MIAPLMNFGAVQDWASVFTNVRWSCLTVGPPGNPVSRRWYVIPENSVGNVYLVRTYRSEDHQAMHDHPSDYTAWVLSGVYMEHLPDGLSIRRGEGDVLTRQATTPHRIEITSGPVLMLYITGPVIREWGYHTPTGWVPWREFG